MYRLYRASGYVIISLAFVLAIARAVLPWFPLPISNEWVQNKVGLNIEFQSMEVLWRGLTPAVSLKKVSLGEQDDTPLKVDVAFIQISLLKSIFAMQWQVEDVILQGAKLTIMESKEGIWRLVGLPTTTRNERDKRFDYKSLALVDSDIELTLQDQSHYSFREVRLTLDKSTAGKKINLSGSLVKDSISYVVLGLEQDSSGAFTALHLKANDLNLADLSGLEARFNSDWNIPSKGMVNFELNTRFADNRLIRAHANVDAKNAEFNYQDKAYKFPSLHTQAHFIQSENDWRLILSELPSPNDENQGILGLKKVGDDYLIGVNDLNLKLLESLPLSDYRLKGDIHFARARLNSEFLISDIGAQFANLELVDKAQSLISKADGALWFDGTLGAIDLEGAALNWGATEAELGATHSVFALKTKAPEIHLYKFNSLLDGTELKFQGIIGEQMALSGYLGSMEARKVIAFLSPELVGAKLYKWLDSAFKSGRLEESHLLLRGKSSDFPFKKDQGVFQLHSRFKKLDLKYHPEWPILEKMDGHMHFEQQQLNVRVDDASLVKGRVKASAIIPDISSDAVVIKVDANVKSDLQSGLKAISQSPLKETVGSKFEHLEMGGPMSLNLGLTVPLGQSAKPVGVKGLMEILGCELAVPDWDLDVQALRGEIKFTNDYVQGKKMTGRMFDEIIDLSFEQFEELSIVAKGQAPFTKIANWQNWPNDLPIEGMFPYVAKLKINEASSGELNIKSQLEGIQIDLPYPFDKDTKINRDFEFKLYFDADSPTRVMAHYANSAHLALKLSRSKPKQVQSINVRFGHGALPEFRFDKTFMIDGKIEQLALEDWIDYYNRQSFTQEGSNKLFDLDPEVNLLVEKLSYQSYFLKNTQVKAYPDTHGNWQMTFEGNELDGTVAFPQEGIDQDILIDLNRFKINKAPESRKKSNLNFADFEAWPISFNAKQVQIENRIFRNVGMDLKPNTLGYEIEILQATSSETELEANGVWEFKNQPNRVQLEGALSTSNVAKALALFGQPTSIESAQGYIDFNFRWLGDLSSVDLVSLRGNASVDLSQGLILDIDPGFGRVLGLLNVDSIQRRLRLDFSDVAKKGMSFDRLKGNFEFFSGKVSTDDLKIQGPSATINYTGEAGLESRRVNGVLVVMPNVTGSLPLAAAIAAGNPAVGAAMWVVDKVIGSTIQEITKFSYQVSGTWESPELIELASDMGSSPILKR